MESIEVTARFTPDGHIIPLQITWNGRAYGIESTGRRWEAENGRHILATLPGDQVVELLFAPLECRWYVRQVGLGRAMA